jgi:hypothetical protein
MIFESPDKGKTIFAREPLTLERVQISTDSEKSTDSWQIWQDILKAGQTNPALKEALDSAQIIYELSRNDKS